MPSFEYQALTAEGKQRKGFIEADTDRLARQSLRDEGLIPVDVAMTNRANAKASLSIFRRGVPSLQIALFARQLATLVDSGIPVEEALQVAAEQTRHSRLRKALLAVRSQVREGHTLADSLRKQPHIFTQVFCALVYAGEKTGDLGAVLNRLAEYLEARQSLRSSTVQGLVYPAVLVVVAIGVVAILMSFVVPKVVAQFDYAQQQLPNVTKILIVLSDGVQDYGLIGLLLVIGATLLAAVFFRQDTRKLWLHQTLLKLPLCAGLIIAINSARLLRTLHILVDSGVPLLDALRVGKETLTNKYMRQLLTAASSEVESGVSLHKALAAQKIFPVLAIYMIASGEKSGELPRMLDKAAQSQEQQLKTTFSMFVSLFEPALIIVLGGVVMFIVLAILLPILQLNNFNPV